MMKYLLYIFLAYFVLFVSFCCVIVRENFNINPDVTLYKPLPCHNFCSPTNRCIITGTYCTKDKQCFGCTGTPSDQNLPEPYSKSLDMPPETAAPLTYLERASTWIPAYKKKQQIQKKNKIDYENMGTDSFDYETDYKNSPTTTGMFETQEAEPY